MAPIDVRDRIQSFIDLIEHGSGEPYELEQRLIRVLDGLAEAMHTPSPGELTDDADAPRVAYADARRLVEARFPDLGTYYAAQLLDGPSKAERLVGDAHDDLADIYIDLRDAAWMWDNVSPADGHFELTSGFHTHLQWHMRDLQSYLQIRANPR